MNTRRQDFEDAFLSDSRLSIWVRQAFGSAISTSNDLQDTLQEIEMLKVAIQEYHGVQLLPCEN